MAPAASALHIVTFDLGRWVGATLPGEIVEAAREHLRRAGRRLRGALVLAFGRDLHIHLATCASDFRAAESPAAYARTLAGEAALAALERATRKGLASTHLVVSGSDAAVDGILELHHAELPYSERSSEPLFVAKALNGSWGFFNRALFNLFFNPDKGSGRRIEGNEYAAVVESIADLASGRSPVRAFELGPADGNELLALVADADEWRLTEVYAVRGAFGSGPCKDEPAARVAGGRNPVLVGRCQSGLPAVGEYTQAVGTFCFGPGGAAGAYRVGLVPTTFAEARDGADSPGVARVVAYAYQSYGGGRIPDGDDVVDLFAANPAETRHLQREALALVRHMTGHGEFEPYLAPFAAAQRAGAMADFLSDRFRPIPAGHDPVVVAANQRALFTVSDIKAGAGGRAGHTSAPRHFGPTAEASLQVAHQDGLILAGSAFLAVGDDGHLLMTHARGADDNSVHLLAFSTFYRQVWVAETLGYRWHGPGRDLAGEGAAGQSAAALASLDEAFLAALRERLPAPETRRFAEIEAAFADWRAGGRGPAPSFAGSVSGQGPGFAELPMPRAAPVGLFAIDKAGLAAFNLPVWEALGRCRADGSLARYLEGTGTFGIVLEIWDVDGRRRVFLDLASEGEWTERLLGATDTFNVKRIWTRTDEWNPFAPEPLLGDVLLAASTEKLGVLTGGAHRGPDDPVLLAVEPLAAALNLFMRDGFYLTAGGGRGAHASCPVPLALAQAVATVDARVVAVSAMLAFDAHGEIRGIRDVFADPLYDEARERALALSRTIADAQGGAFAPAGACRVGQSNPLARTIARITAPGSPYERRRPARGGGRL